MRALFAPFGRYKKDAALSVVGTVGEVVMEVFIPFITAYLIDRGIEAGDMDAVIFYGVLMLAMAFLSLGFGLLAGYFSATAATGYACSLREAIFDKVQTYSFGNIDKFSTAGLVTRMTTDVTNIQNAALMLLRIAVRTPVMLVSSLVMFLSISMDLSPVIIVAAIFLAIAFTLIVTNATRVFNRVFDTYDDLNASVQENVGAIRVVKAFVREVYEKERFRTAAENPYRLFVRAEGIVALNNPVMMIAINSCIIAVSWLGAHLVVGGSMTIGQLTSAFSYVSQMLMSLMMLSMIAVMITMSMASARRINQALEETPDIANPADPVHEVADGSIDFDHVSFAYATGDGEDVLEDIALHIASGETIGIIGGTGSGKSSLVNLLSRLYDVTDGSVRVGGVDVRAYDLEALRDNVAVVLQKNVLFSGTIAENLRYMLKNYGALFCFVVVCIAVSAYAINRSMLFTQILIDDCIEPMLASGSTDFSGLAAEIARLAILLVVGVLASYGFNRLMVTIGQGTMKKLREDVFEHMEGLPIRYFDTHAHGDIMSVYTNDVDTLRQFYGQTLPQLVNSTITLVVTFTTMVALSVPLTAISVVMVALMLFVTGRVSAVAGGYFAQQQADLGAVDGFIEEMMDGQKVVKVFNHEVDASADFRAANGRLRESSKRANLISNLIMPLNANLGNISCVIVSMVGGAMALSGNWGLTLGALASFITLNRNFSQPITQISQQMNFVTMAAAGSRRVFALLDEEPEADDGYVTLVNARETADGKLEPCEERTGIWAWRWPHRATGEVEYVRQAGELVMDGVDFGYVPNKIVLHDITLFAKPGQKIAFMGSTGAGKTTITNLINRFYDIEDGKIRYDGININKINKKDLRRSLGIVLQDTNLFTGTVMDNIRYGRLDATDEECIAAAKAIFADACIERLPHGYNEMLQERGEGLSAGEKQLISFARIIVKNPSVVILDEATSSISSDTEKLIQQALEIILKGRTSFIVAHRLSTIRNADRILFIANKGIAEEGSHEQLLKAHGLYYNLYKSLNQ